MLINYIYGLERRIRPSLSKLFNLLKKSFECPVCSYCGPFMDLAPSTGHRKHAQCPNCKSLERHRLQFLVVNRVFNDRDMSHLKMLHFAPEPIFREFFSQRFGKYESADLSMKDVDYNIDLQQLPFADETYDFIFASHVLEHIPNDKKAVSEIRRILKPNGIAIIPVPIVADITIEYSEPNPYEDYHVRAPGVDYFDRFNSHFSKVVKISSDLLPSKYQLFIYEDRSQWPSKECPLRPSMKGIKHIDIVPVCYV